MSKLKAFWNRYSTWVRWIWLGLLLLCTIFLIIRIFPFYNADSYTGEAGKVRTLNTAVLTENGSSREEKLPLQIKNLKGGTNVQAEFTFYNMQSDCYVQVRSAFAPITVYVNGEKVYAFGSEDERPPYMKDPGTVMHFIPVRYTGTVTITIYYTSPYARDTLTISPVLVSNQSGLVRNCTVHMGGILFGSLVLFIAGLLLIMVALMVIQLDRSGVSFLWLGLFMLLTGVWGFSSCDMALFFFSDTNLWYLLSYLSFFSLVLPLELLLEENVGFHLRRMTTILRIILMVLLLTTVILQMTGRVMFIQSAQLYQILLPLSIFCFTAAVIFEAVKYHNRKANRWIVPMLILSFSTASELAYYNSIEAYTSTRYFLIGVMVFSIVMSVNGAVNIRESVRISRKEKEQEYQLSLMNRTIGEQKKYQETLLEHEQELRRQRHDFKHHIAVLQEYARNGKVEDLQAYLQRLRDSIPSRNNAQYTENISINAVVAYYAQMAEDTGASVKIDIALPRELSHDVEQNLCVVFGNLLENAAEAIRRIPDENQKAKFIRLTAMVHMGNLVIHMENSMAGKPRKWGRFFVSSKRDEVGIGLTSIANIAELYNGDAEFRSENGHFISDVYFAISE
ncbi:MAG: sensor histidine kinase [Bilifractor sp.]